MDSYRYRGMNERRYSLAVAVVRSGDVEELSFVAGGGGKEAADVQTLTRRRLLGKHLRWNPS